MLTEEQIREICLNISNGYVNSDKTPDVPRNCFNPGLYIGAYQALKYTYLPHMEVKQEVIDKLSEQLGNLEAVTYNRED